MGENFDMLATFAIVGMVTICAVLSFCVYLFAHAASPVTVLVVLLVLIVAAWISWAIRNSFRGGF